MTVPGCLNAMVMAVRAALAPVGMVATGGTITTDGAYTVHTFTAGGTFTVTGSGTVDVLAVGGGGGGGGNLRDGGGGGGGFQYVTAHPVAAGAYAVTVGAGGAPHTNGGNSVFDTITAYGGGRGGAYTSYIDNGADGGCGGGGGTQGIPAGQALGGTGSQGGNGGKSITGSGIGGWVAGGGGGGASGIGTDASGSNAPSTQQTPGDGGAGTANSISGASVTYAGGGAGEGLTAAGVNFSGTGGVGGGGSNSNGTDGLGGGGGGGAAWSGGSGVVIIRYPTPAPAPDPFAANVVSLLHFEGADASTTFTDSCASPNIFTAYGNAHISTAQKQFGSASGAFDGAGSYLTTPHSAALNLVGVDFTIEGWVYLTSLTSGNMEIVGKDGIAGVSYMQWDVAITPAGKLVVWLGNGNGVSNPGTGYTGTTAMTLNAWHHFALVKSGSTCLGFVDGAQEWSAPAATMYDGGKPVYVGYQDGQPAASFLHGYIDELRITKGVARYTAPFTPPTAAFAL